MMTQMDYVRTNSQERALKWAEGKVSAPGGTHVRLSAESSAKSSCSRVLILGTCFQTVTHDPGLSIISV